MRDRRKLRPVRHQNSPEAQSEQTWGLNNHTSPTRGASLQVLDALFQLTVAVLTESTKDKIRSLAQEKGLDAYLQRHGPSPGWAFVMEQSGRLISGKTHRLRDDEALVLLHLVQ